jgi:hypothetical protein
MFPTLALALKISRKSAGSSFFLPPSRDDFEISIPRLREIHDHVTEEIVPAFLGLFPNSPYSRLIPP